MTRRGRGQRGCRQVGGCGRDWTQRVGGGARRKGWSFGVGGDIFVVFFRLTKKENRYCDGTCIDTTWPINPLSAVWSATYGGSPGGRPPGGGGPE